MSLIPPLPLPAGVDLVTFDIPGGPLAALDTAASPGADPDRAPVLLVPGFTGSKEDFRELLQPLSAAGHRVVALDLRGQFQSPGPADPSAYVVDALAADVLAVAQRLDAPAVHLLGHSFGGLVARAAVLQRPAAVRSLVLMSSGPAGLTGPRVDAMSVLRPLLLQSGLAAVAEAIEAAAALDPARPEVPPEIAEFLRMRFLASSEVGLLAMSDALVDEPDRVDALRDSGVPVLVLHGERDDAWLPAVQERMAQRLGAQHVVVPGAAHSPAVEDAAATAAAVAGFLARAECGVGAR